MQITVGLGVATYLAVHPPNGSFATSVNVPYGKELFLEHRLAVLRHGHLDGRRLESNAVSSLTDGLDGLAAGSVIFCALAYAMLAYVVPET